MYILRVPRREEEGGGMTFEQLHDLYFSQPDVKLDERALRYFWDVAVAEERERCIKAGWAEICRQNEYEAWPTEDGFVAAIRAQP